MNVKLDGLRLQLLGLFVLPVALLVLAMAIIAVGIHRQAMRALVAERDERAAVAGASAIETALRARLSVIDSIAVQSGVEAPPLAEGLTADLYRDEFPLGLALFVSEGERIAGDDLELLPAPVDQSLTLLAEDRILTHEIRGEVVVLVGAAAPRGIAVGAVPLTELVLPAIRGLAGPEDGGRAYIVSAGSELLLALGGPAPTDLPNHTGVQAALRGDHGSSFLPMSDGEHVVAYAPIPSAGWALVVEEPWETVSSSLLDLSLLAPFSLVPILALALLGLWFGARRVIQPLRRLEEAASELPTGNAEAIQRPTGGIAEIEELRATLARMSNRVQEAQSALRAYIADITNAQEEERRRVARELHDESIQHWIALDQRLQMAASRLRDQENPEAKLLAELHQVVQAGVQDLRRISRGLRPIYLEDLGLVPAVDMLVRDVRESLRIPIQFEVQGHETRLGAEAELAVYRLVQEGLSNVSRHAKASRVQVKINFEPDLVHITVADDGRGFAPPDQLEELAAAGHYGLIGMKERTDALGGEIAIESSPDEGCTVSISIPSRRGGGPA